MLQLSVLPLATALLLSCSTKRMVKADSEINATTSKIEVLDVSDTEMDSLQKMNPRSYTNGKASEFQKTKLTYLDRKGNITTKTTYEKTPVFQPPIILPKTKLDVYEISEIITESVSATDPTVVALRAAHPEEFGDAPNADYKTHKMKYILKDSSVVELISFQKVD